MRASSSVAGVVQKTLTLTAKVLSKRAVPGSKSAIARVASASSPDATCSGFRRRVRSIAVADRSIRSKLPLSRPSQTSEAADAGAAADLEQAVARLDAKR